MTRLSCVGGTLSRGNREDTAPADFERHNDPRFDAFLMVMVPYLFAPSMGLSGLLKHFSCRDDELLGIAEPLLAFFFSVDFAYKDLRLGGVGGKSASLFSCSSDINDGMLLVNSGNIT